MEVVLPMIETMRVALLLLLVGARCGLCEVPASCRETGWLRQDARQRWAAADIVLLAKDTTPRAACRPGLLSCDPPVPGALREFSVLAVRCVLKNARGVRVPARVTAQPRAGYGQQCSATRFTPDETGWLYLVTLSHDAETGAFYWDDVNGQPAVTTVYSEEDSDRLREAANVCLLDMRQAITEGSCPSSLGPGPRQDCFSGCPRGWRMTSHSDTCYWFSDVTAGVGQNEAAVACAVNEGGRLLALSSERERDTLSDDLLTPYKEAGLDVEWWSSGSLTPGGWQWTSEAAPSARGFRFMEWRPQEPGPAVSPGAGVAVVYSTTRWGWRDADPATRLPYICERPRGSVLAPPWPCSLTSDPACRLLLARSLSSPAPAGLWFSSPPAARCTPSPLAAACRLPASQLTTVAARLFRTNAFSPYTLDTDITITVSAPVASVRACGQTYRYGAFRAQFPASGGQAVPGAESGVPAVYLRSAGNLGISWSTEGREGAAGERYTVMLVDVGRRTLSALWTNATDGSLQGAAQELAVYSPPRPPAAGLPTAAAVLLWRQSGESAGLSAQAVATSFSGELDVDRLAEALMLEGPLGAVVFPVLYDVFSASQHEARGVASCHEFLLHSAPPTVLSALQAPGVDPPQLLARLDITHVAPADQIEICCQKVTYRSSSVQLSPQEDPGQTEPFYRLQFKPRVTIIRGATEARNHSREDVFSDTYYTLLMLQFMMNESTNTGASNLTQTPSLRWLVGNIRDGDVTTGTPVVPHGLLPPPVPTFPSSASRTLLVYVLLEQETGLVKEVQDLVPENCRLGGCAAFHLPSFLHDRRLVTAGISWAFAGWDAAAAAAHVARGEPQTAVLCAHVTPNVPPPTVDSPRGPQLVDCDTAGKQAAQSTSTAAGRVLQQQVAVAAAAVYWWLVVLDGL